MKHLFKHHENALCGAGVALLVPLALLTAPRALLGPYWGPVVSFVVALACAGWVWSVLRAWANADEEPWVTRATTPLSVEELERLERMWGVEVEGI